MNVYRIKSNRILNTLLLFGLLFSYYSFGQLKQHQFGVNVNYRGFNKSKNAVSFNGSYGFEMGRLNAFVNVGMEYWYPDEEVSSNLYITKPTTTGKAELLLGRRMSIKNTSFSWGLNTGVGFYFRNKVKDSITILSEKGLSMKRLKISYVSPRIIVSDENPLFYGLYSFGSHFYYVRSMPLEIPVQVSFNYDINAIRLTAMVKPYAVRVKYENEYYPEIRGYKWILLNDIGFTLSYRFQHKH